MENKASEFSPSASSFDSSFKKGFLEKRGNLRTSFKKRFFILDGTRIWYYKKENDSKPCGCIHIEGVTVRNDLKDSQAIIIQHPERRTYILHSSSREIIEDWKEAITKNAGTQEKKKRGSAIISEQGRVPIFQGHLEIGEVGAWKSINWTRRYCLLRKNILFCFENDKNLTVPLGWILLNDSFIEEADYIPDFKKFSFIICHPKRKPALLSCDTQEIFDAWITTIRSACTAPSETNEEREKRRQNVQILINKKDAKKSGILEGITLLDTLGKIDLKGLFQTPRSGSIEWGYRFLILKENLLFILVSEKDVEADMVVDLEDYVIEPVTAIGKKYTFDIFHPACISVTVAALDHAQYEIWIEGLRKAIKNITESASHELMIAPRATRMIRSPNGIVELRGPRKPIFMGELSIRTGPKSLDPKFFTLRRNILFYFKAKHIAAFDPFGVIPLDSCYVDRLGDLELCIKHKLRREVRLVASTAGEIDDWIETIEQACAIDISEEGKKNPLLDLNKRKEEAEANKLDKKKKKDLPFLDTLATPQQHGILLVRRRDNGSWNRNYFILKDNVLFLCKDKSDVWPYNAVELEDYEVKVIDEKKNIFEISHPHSPCFILSAQTSNLMQSWVDALTKAVDLIRDFSDNLKADAMLAEAQRSGKSRKSTRVKREEAENEVEERKEEQKNEEEKDAEV